jgi:hypothetical protein
VEPLGNNVKMIGTPPNEEPTIAVQNQAGTVPSGPASNTVAEAVNETPNTGITEKKKKPKKDKEPLPGETRAERKKRKKAEALAVSTEFF